MNLKTLSITIILIGFVGLLSFACEDKNSTSPRDKPQSIGEKKLAPASSVEMYGVLERSASGGLVLTDGQVHHDLKCDSDLSSLIGRKVKVNGTLKTNSFGSFIQVIQVVEEAANLTEETKLNTTEEINSNTKETTDEN